MLNRRGLLIGTGAACLGPLVVQARDLQSPEEARWIVGTWRSDAEPSIALYRFPSPTASARSYELLKDMFGRMTHIYTPTHFESVYAEPSGRAFSYGKWPYVVAGTTSSSIRIEFPGRPKGGPPMSLYRADENTYFGRIGKNYDFYKRIA